MKRNVHVFDNGVKVYDDHLTPIQRDRYKQRNVHGLKTLNATQTIKTKTLDNLCKKIGRLVDLCQMDVQGLELDVLEGARRALQTGSVKTFLIGTHSQKLHEGCINLLAENGYVIEYDNYTTKEQPDGILVASKGFQRLGVSQDKL